MVDRPLIQYAVDEALDAGIENLIFVTGRGKTAIEDHFDVSYELEATLASRNDLETLALLQDIRPLPGQVAYVRQMEPLGLGHAVWCARNLVGSEPFAVILADDLLQPTGSALKAMVAEYEATGANVVLVQEVPAADTNRYGIIEPGSRSETATNVVGIVEKPEAGSAPSNLGVIGRYILDASMMDHLAKTPAGALGEIQLTDGLAASLGDRELHAITDPGVRFDCGSKIGLIEATISIALERDDLGPQVKELLRRLS